MEKKGEEEKSESPGENTFYPFLLPLFPVYRKGERPLKSEDLLYVVLQPKKKRLETEQRPATQGESPFLDRSAFIGVPSSCAVISKISCLPSCLGKSWPNSHLGGGSIFSAACGWELAGGAISSFCQGLKERGGDKSAGLLFLISAILAKRDGFHRKKEG